MPAVSAANPKMPTVSAATTRAPRARACDSPLHPRRLRVRRRCLCVAGDTALLTVVGPPPAAAAADVAHQQTVTLTTQCTLDRWPRVRQQAASWRGPVSVCCYIPAPAGTSTAAACLQLLRQLVAEHAERHPLQHLAVSVLHADNWAEHGLTSLQQGAVEPSQLDHPLLQPAGAQPLPADAASSSDAADTATPWRELYPINALRNIALQHATTPLVLPIDADLILSEGLQQQLHTPTQRPGSGGSSLSLAQQLLQAAEQQQRPVMLVLPAFQLTMPGSVPDTVALQVPRAKPDLAAALAAGAVQRFDCGVFALAPEDEPIKTDQWLAAEAPWEVAYPGELWEVHAGVAAAATLPRYSELFAGYGLNKQQHAWHAAQILGFRFLVLPDAFVVTARHARPLAWRACPGSAADQAHLTRMRGVYRQFQDEMLQRQQEQR